MRRILILLCLFLSLACSSWAEVTITETTEYYPVNGLGKKAILRNLTNQTPIVIKGRKFHGHTKAKTKYKFTWVQNGDTCSLQKVSVNLHLTYTYPKLASPQSKSTMQWWEKHLSKLKVHELGHGKIAIEGAHKLDRDLSELKRLKCATAKSRVKALANSILQRTRTRQVKYDTLTKHGKKQELYKGKI